MNNINSPLAQIMIACKGQKYQSHFKSRISLVTSYIRNPIWMSTEQVIGLFHNTEQYCFAICFSGLWPMCCVTVSSAVATFSDWIKFRMRGWAESGSESGFQSSDICTWLGNGWAIWYWFKSCSSTYTQYSKKLLCYLLFQEKQQEKKISYPDM